MRSPNSPIVRLRMWLSDKLKVYPPNGEAWCVDCCRNEYKTIVVNADGMRIHLRQHSRKDYVHVLTEDRRKFR
jgi:hypothetical protein